MTGDLVNITIATGMALFLVAGGLMMVQMTWAEFRRSPKLRELPVFGCLFLFELGVIAYGVAFAIAIGQETL